ncbi:flagellar hook-basal body complex protein [Aeribacillus pallidus]|uniref:flagellar hook protein FlgE n=1 Tax=Aeribacillus pallidus TaxID=33936 RepID=UPI00102372A2|nr:flagellar hook-basal body complex protein [Aeribacillus pallidus]RZI52979.1 flagellar hook-basal body complex protein [Aeribacillus pallidus]
MLRSMYSGISGMKNFQLKLDVIGNNIANVNTYGFKKGRVTFKELVNQQISGASAAVNGRGGINPAQVGLGAAIGTIDTVHTSGPTQSTGRLLDVAISGDGFFPVGVITDLTRVNIDYAGQFGDNKILGAIDRAIDLAYTRAGNFYLDANGYLVTGEGLYLIGETGEKIPPTDQGIQKANAALQQITSFNTPYKNMYESLRDISKRANALMEAYEAYNDAVELWEKDGRQNPSPLYTSMQNARNALIDIWTEFNAAITNPTSGFGNIRDQFETAIGQLNNSINNFNNTPPYTDVITTITNPILPITAGDYPQNPSTAIPLGSSADTNTLDLMTKLIGTIENYKVALNNVGQAVIKYEDIAESLKEAQWTDSLSGEAGLIQIPLSAKSFSIGSDGKVTFIDRNGQLKVAGQIRLANFPNPEGLEKIGSNLFRETPNSGSIDKNGNGLQLNELSVPGEDGAGSLINSSLEMSNVDLAEEFTEMIVAQRGFQSNTKIITTSDEILQELLGLKR